MCRRWTLSLLFGLFAPFVWAQPASPPPDRLPPPVEHVLTQLTLDAAAREQVRQTLLRQRQERQGADAEMHARHRAELAALLTPDQLAALEAARPPRGQHPHGPRPQAR